MAIRCRAIGAPPPLSELALASALADALLPSVPCFRAHWRAMARAVQQLLRDGGSVSDAVPALPQLYREVLCVLARDALIMGGGEDRADAPELQYEWTVLG